MNNNDKWVVVCMITIVLSCMMSVLTTIYQHNMLLSFCFLFLALFGFANISVIYNSDETKLLDKPFKTVIHFEALNHQGD